MTKALAEDECGGVMIEQGFNRMTTQEPIESNLERQAAQAAGMREVVEVNTFDFFGFDLAANRTISVIEREPQYLVTAMLELDGQVRADALQAADLIGRSDR